MRHGPSGQSVCPVLPLPRSRWGQGAGAQRRSRKAVFAATRLVVTTEERHLVGGTGTPAGSQAGDGLDHEAEDYGGDGPAQGGSSRCRAGWRWTTSISAACVWAASGAGAQVSTSPQGRPRKVELVPVKGFRKLEIARFAKCHLNAGTRTITDGLNCCWTVFDRTGAARDSGTIRVPVLL